MITHKETIYNELLVLRCRRGDNDAFKELIGNWERRIFYYIRRLVSDEQDAWDILQETWMKAFNGIGRLREPGRLPTWLYRIARNTAVSHIRHESIRKKLLKELVNKDSRSETVTPDDTVFGFDDAALVHKGLEMLSITHREVLTLHFLEDMTVEEIAEVLDVPPGTVKSRLYYAKRALKKVWTEDRSDEIIA